MNKITELQERSNLNEGRNYGIGFSILNKISNNKYETYLPFTACRDYLNDFSYVEYTKKEIGKIHGYDHKLLNCFDRKRYFYIGVNTLHNNGGGHWAKKDDAEKLLISNKDNLENLINKVEDYIGLKTKSKVIIDENTLIIKAPIYWSKTTVLISLFTLLIRCHFNIELNDSDLIEQLKADKCYIVDDEYMKGYIISFLEQKDKFKTTIDYNKLGIKDKADIHNFGIQGYLSKIKYE